MGSLSDPRAFPGLAHFTEHMLFYSSAKYPVEVRADAGGGPGMCRCRALPACIYLPTAFLALVPPPPTWSRPHRPSFLPLPLLCNPSTPSQDEYTKFISDHGGATNAYTSAEHTNYHVSS